MATSSRRTMLDTLSEVESECGVNGSSHGEVSSFIREPVKALSNTSAFNLSQSPTSSHDGLNDGVVLT